MDPSKIFLYFGYAMAGIFGAIGIYVLFLFPPQLQLPENFRITFGILLILYGVYRFFSLRIKQRQDDEDES
jgi:hypothetical protein